MSVGAIIHTFFNLSTLNFKINSNMIFSHKYRYLFISMPKTGTHTMYHILQNKFSGQRYGHWHENVPPKFTQDYFKFITVRNPYTKFASIWYYVSSDDAPYKAIYEKLMGHKMEIMYFLNWIIDVRDELYYFRDPQGRLYQMSTMIMPQYLNLEQRLHNIPIDRFIKMENLLGGINDLPFLSENRRLSRIPQLYTAAPDPHYKTWDEIKTPEIIKLVNQYAEKDFNLFSYEKE